MSVFRNPWFWIRSVVGGVLVAALASWAGIDRHTPFGAAVILTGDFVSAFANVLYSVRWIR